MSAITLKNLPEELLRDLRDAAASHHRSLNQHAIFLLQLGLGRPNAEAEMLHADQAQLAAWQELIGQWRSAETTKTEIRRIYRRRSSGRKVDL